VAEQGNMWQALPDPAAAPGAVAVADCSAASYLGPTDNARHFIGCHLTQQTRHESALDDRASIISQSLPPAAAA